MSSKLAAKEATPKANRLASVAHETQDTSSARLAFLLVIEMYRSTSGRAMSLRGIRTIAMAAGITNRRQQKIAISHAVKCGLLEVIGSHSIRLTEQGRQLLR